MSRPATIILFVICFIETQAQYNIVSNSSFEDYIQCPDNAGGNGQLHFAIGWFNPNNGSPDYLNECAQPTFFPPDIYIPSSVDVPMNGWGYQEAKTGAAYAGFYAHQVSPHREYIQVQLNDKLIQDKKYVFSAYISLADKIGLGSKIGAFFSDTEIDSDSDNLWQYTAQIITSFSVIDKDNWVLWQDTITSESGNEEYLVIGNFLDVINSDTIYSGTDSGGYRWSSYYYIDDVSVVAIDTTIGIEENENVRFEVYPNPAKEKLTIELAENWQNTAIKIFDVTGREVLTYLFRTKQASIDVSGFAAGVYTAVLLQNEGVVARKKIIIE